MACLLHSVDQDLVQGRSVNLNRAVVAHEDVLQSSLLQSLLLFELLEHFGVPKDFFLQSLLGFVNDDLVKGGVSRSVFH